MREAQRFDFMVDPNAFISIFSWLVVFVQKLPVVVSDRKPACSRDGETSIIICSCHWRIVRPNSKSFSVTSITGTKKKESYNLVHCLNRRQIVWISPKPTISPLPKALETTVGSKEEWVLVKNTGGKSNELVLCLLKKQTDKQKQNYRRRPAVVCELTKGPLRKKIKIFSNEKSWMRQERQHQRK